MDRETILAELAPCGLDCSRCFGYGDGEIKKLALALLDKLGNFDRYAGRLAKFMPVFEGYKQFHELLLFFGKASCAGCRQGGGTFPLCSAKTCFREKNVDFCFQCDEYPCERNQFPPDLQARWRRMNDRMRETGVEQFYAEQKKEPRYP
ncbi:DUF3795 domain-containing protein [Desulforudis sp. 1088]|uniref:DUF3795 domain-containing protein n=1 Tax=unclassified Candidatus Desulforudis TaxID=2635950 RepID=UPI003469956E